jgi:hypothetical protein
MLVAQKEGKGFEAMASSSNPVLRSFGKVVGSIEGLRHRLDTFGVDEIDEALQKIKTLTVRLSELQESLEKLLIIRRLVAHVDSVNSHSHSTDDKPESTLPSFQPFSASANIIMFPRIGRPNIKEPAGEEEIDAAPAVARLSVGSETGAKPGERHANVEQVDMGQAFVYESAGQESSTPESHQPPVHLNETVFEDDGKESVQAHLSKDDSDNSYVLYEPVKPSHEIRSDTDGSPSDVSNNSDSFDSSPASQNSAFEFDRRLLNELIKDYGEFVIPAQSSTAAIEETTTAGIASNRDVQTHAEFPHVENATIQSPLPKSRKDGDLDRKLKKLIKDYGEYDLYAHKNRKKINPKAVAAVILIAMVLAAVYFFSSSRETAPLNSVRPTQSESGINSLGAGEADSPANTKSFINSQSSTDKPQVENRSSRTRSTKTQ